MFCPACGTQAITDAKFCAQCGGPMPGTVTAAVPPVAAPQVINLYAGFWRRVGAALIDFSIAILLADLLLYAMGDGLFSGYMLLALLFVLIYFTVLEGQFRGATPGKMLFGIKVTNKDGEALGIGRAILRQFGKLLSLLTIGIGFVICAFTARRRALHDMMSGSLVVSVDAAPAAIAAGTGASMAFNGRAPGALALSLVVMVIFYASVGGLEEMDEARTARILAPYHPVLADHANGNQPATQAYYLSGFHGAPENAATPSQESSGGSGQGAGKPDMR